MAAAPQPQPQPAQHISALVAFPARDVELGTLFDLADTNKSGKIEVKELVALWHLVKPSATIEEIKKEFAAIDKSKDGTIDKKEFVSAYLAHFKADDEKTFFNRIETTKKYIVRKPRLSEVFDYFDSDKNGSLNRGEIFRMIRLSKPKFTNEDLTQIFNKMDADHDHKVSKDEFINYYFKLFFAETNNEFEHRIEEAFAGRRKVKLQMVFQAYDQDGDGVLSLNEFSAMLKLNGRKFVSADEILNTLVKIDRNHDRKVEYDEWLDFMGGLIAHMDDRHFNKAIKNMLDAAKDANNAKAQAHAKLQAGVIAASANPSAAASAAPAVGSSAGPSAAHPGKAENPHTHGHGHGHTHK